MAKGVKTGGRTQGTPNKFKMKAAELCEQLGCDPLEVLIHFAKGDWAALGYKDPTYIKSVTEDKATFAEVITPESRLQAAKEALKYVRPILKAIEHSGEISNPYLNKSVDELEVLVKEKLKK